MNPLHLRWATQKENESDKAAHGTHNRGDRHNLAKLNDPVVLLIRHLVTNGKSKAHIASVLGVSPDTIKLIVRRKTWRHVHVHDSPELIKIIKRIAECAEVDEIMTKVGAMRTNNLPDAEVEGIAGEAE